MKIRAFVFEDDDNVRDLITTILEKRGYEVNAFSEPDTCPLYLDHDCPCPLGHECGDIIVTDINMPKINGLDFIENQLNHGCKVNNFAVMSGTWTDKHADRAKSLGLYMFKKPFDVKDFNNWLDDCEKRLNPKRKLADWFKHRHKEDKDTS